MSEFACPVVRLQVLPHPNADQLELAKIGDYMAVVRKDQFVTGELAVYIPEQAVVPEWLLREMNMWDDERKKGGLAGSLGNRVKAIKLRGVLSQGLIYAPALNNDTGNRSLVIRVVDENKDVALDFLCSGWRDMTREKFNELGAAPVAFGAILTDEMEGMDFAAILGIVKYEPKLPSYMNARVVGADFGATHKYDFDNLKKMPTMFDDGEEVVITEKIHGTLMMVGVVPSAQANDKYYKSRVIISSKGMGAKGFVLDHNDEGSVYAQASAKHDLLNKVLLAFGELADSYEKPVFLIGEVFGKTAGGGDIQDLTYTDEPLDFRAFDICIGNRGKEKYAPWLSFESMCGAHEIPVVPKLYHGPYSKGIVLEHTDGPTTLVPPRGKVAHIREGVVVKSAQENRSPHFGRKIAKSVSEAYLLRKNATEFN